MSAPIADPTPEQRLAALRNIGKRTAAWLVEANIRTRQDLIRVGTVEACRRMLQAGHPITVIAAYAIEGALMDVHWNAIPIEMKKHLATEFRTMKK